MSQVDTLEVIKIRDLAVQVSRAQTVSEDVAEDARDSIRAICKEASKFGLTTADVVRAVFRPALETRAKGCNCPTCRSRQSRLDPDNPIHADDAANHSPAS